MVLNDYLGMAVLFIIRQFQVGIMCKELTKKTWVVGSMCRWGLERKLSTLLGLNTIPGRDRETPPRAVFWDCLYSPPTLHVTASIAITNTPYYCDYHQWRRCMLLRLSPLPTLHVLIHAAIFHFCIGKLSHENHENAHFILASFPGVIYAVEGNIRSQTNAVS